MNVQWLRDETELLESYVSLLVELASARSWSQMVFTNNLPLAFAGVFHEDPRSAAQLLQYQKRIWEAVLKAETMASDTTVPKRIREELKERLYDVSWNQLQVSREIYVQCAKSNWEVGDPKIKELSRMCFGGPCNTKADLEDLFAHLASIAKMSTLATPMSKCLL